MGYWGHRCVGCKGIHEAAFWYYRLREGSKTGKEFLCGERYNESKNRAGGIAFDPAAERRKKQRRR